MLNVTSAHVSIYLFLKESSFYKDATTSSTTLREFIDDIHRDSEEGEGRYDCTGLLYSKSGEYRTSCYFPFCFHGTYWPELNVVSRNFAFIRDLISWKGVV